MAYATAYQINYKPVDGTPVVVNIYDTKTTTTGATNFIDLGYGPDKKYPATPFTDSTIDNNNDKFNTIRAKQATICFFSGSYDASFFSSGEDNRFYVEALVPSTGNIIFRGFILADDNQQPLLPDPQIVTLTATDNIGTLKEIALVDSSGLNPRGKHKIIQYISWALQQTGLQLNINLADSFFEESFPDLPAFDNVYLDGKTFEKDINVSEDCYTVLSKIFGYRLFLSQISGEWWIQNIDEYGLPNAKVFRFDYQGTYLSATTKLYDQTIGRTHDLKFYRKNQVVHYQRAHKFVKLTYNFEYPKEIIDNIDFSRDDKNPFYTNTYTDPVDGKVKTEKRYTLQDWTIGRYSQKSPTPQASSVQTYIKRIFENDYEKERSAVVQYSTENTPLTYIRSNPIPVGVKDRATIGVDFKFNKSSVGDFVGIFGIMLSGDNGKVYVYGQSGVWIDTAVLSTAAANTFFGFSYHYTSGDDKTNWQSYAIDLIDMPAGGDLYLFLPAGYNNAGSGNPDVEYQNIQFDYQPYVNGSYQKYKAITRTVTQPGAYKANVDDTVYIYDGIRELFKGAMFKQVGGQFALTGNWYAGLALAAQGITSPVPDIYLHPLGHLQIYSVWNQYYREMKTIEGTVQGLRTIVNGGTPDMIHLFSIDLVNPATTNKLFLPAKIERDFHMGEFTTTLMEVIDTTIPKDYASPQTITYITDTEG
jgi:hypothetical protein